MTDPVKKPRRFPTGELVGVGALVISGLGLWNSWQSGEKGGPTEIVEKQVAIPLILRGQVENEGRRVVVQPVEDSHALDRVTLTFPGGEAVETGSDGVIEAKAVEAALGDVEDRKGDGSVKVTARADYVEAGTERQVTRGYTIRYRWEGGGLFNGRSLRLTGFARS